MLRQIGRVQTDQIPNGPSEAELKAKMVVRCRGISTQENRLLLGKKVCSRRCPNSQLLALLSSELGGSISIMTPVRPTDKVSYQPPRQDPCQLEA